MEGFARVNRNFAVVAIGRNEGDRLLRCLTSLKGTFPVVYVDSGSTDGSVARAAEFKTYIIELDPREPFTAAKARNAGWRGLPEQGITAEFIQFVDGDCEIEPNWLDAAVAALRQEPELACVFGRRRERYPERSFYNRLCDDEWNVPVGLADWCGGDAMFRAAALQEAGGYNDTIIAGEEPDLCLRLKRMGWRFRRIDHPMTIHDAAIVQFGQWWKRTKRGGHAYAEHVARHGSAAYPQWKRQIISIVLWAAALPVLAVVVLIFGTANSSFYLFIPVLCSIYALQIWRISLKRLRAGYPRHFSWWSSIMVILGKFAEFSGIMSYLLSKARARKTTLIEYKV
jgi:GT2 family glycosyltransferase